MADPTETHLDPDDVATRAAALSLEAEAVRSRVSGLKTRIQDLHAGEPWGDDEVGSAFRSSYLGAGSEEGAAVDTVLDGSVGICDHVSELAEGTGVGAITNRLVDESSSGGMRRLVGRFEEVREETQEGADDLRAETDSAQAAAVQAAAAGQLAAGPATRSQAFPDQAFRGRAVRAASGFTESGPVRRGSPFKNQMWGASGRAIRSSALIREMLADRWPASPLAGREGVATEQPESLPAYRTGPAADASIVDPSSAGSSLVGSSDLGESDMAASSLGASTVESPADPAARPEDVVEQQPGEAEAGPVEPDIGASHRSPDGELAGVAPAGPAGLAEPGEPAESEGQLAGFWDAAPVQRAGPTSAAPEQIETELTEQPVDRPADQQSGESTPGGLPKRALPEPAERLIGPQQHKQPAVSGESPGAA